ncbi:MAG: hypothetical protein ACPLSY_05015 [Moorellaceae bacterium]
MVDDVEIISQHVRAIDEELISFLKGAPYIAGYPERKLLEKKALLLAMKAQYLRWRDFESGLQYRNIESWYGTALAVLRAAYPFELRVDDILAAARVLRRKAQGPRKPILTSYLHRAKEVGLVERVGRGVW